MTMIEMAAIAAFAFTASATPGPNNILLTAVGASLGIWRGFPVLCGVVFGFASMLFLLSMGLGSVFVSLDTKLTVLLKVMGLLVLGYLAYQIASAPISKGDNELSNTVPRRGTFLGAMAFQWVNPKAWMVCASAIATYLDTSGAVLPQALIISAVFVIVALFGCFPWLAMGSFVGRYLTGNRARVFNYTMAGLLVFTMSVALFSGNS